MKTCPSISICIHIACPPQLAEDVCARFVSARTHALCVTVTPTTFIYPGGREHGVTVGLKNYWRTDEDHGEDAYRWLNLMALQLARVLRSESGQDSFSIEHATSMDTFTKEDK